MVIHALEKELPCTPPKSHYFKKQRLKVCSRSEETKEITRYNLQSLTGSEISKSKIVKKDIVEIIDEIR